MSSQEVPQGAEPVSIFQSNLPLEAKLDRARTELLDLSARNRLLNMPRSAKSAKTLEIVDEHSSEIYRLLVKEQRAFTFLAGRQTEGEEDDNLVDLAQPDGEIDDRGFAQRHTDTRLQTRLTSAGLQKRLLDLYYDARTLEEEQGVNILFLALGSLQWVDPNNAANVRYAPLILVPASLERGNAAEKFKLKWRQEDLAANLSLEAYLDRVHGIKLPPFEGGDDLDPIGYMNAVGEAVSAKADWAVNRDDIVLGFFSFAKFLMYRDLDPTTWPAGAELASNELVRSLVSDGFDEGEPLLPDDEPVDRHIPPDNMVHIVDSDSSQTMAVHEVRRGRNLVIQGPPGTGKSQTIANVIASAVADGKTVLFVAEKMAALEVVKRRLDHTGVGDVCLELHSNKANKRAVLEELRRTWELGAPKGEDLATLNRRLTEARDELNNHAERMHTPSGKADFTPYYVVGQLTRLKQAGQQPTDLKLGDPVEWAKDDLYNRSTLLGELIERVRDIGLPRSHVWRGVELTSALPTDVDRLVARLDGLILRLRQITEEGSALAGTLELTTPTSCREFDDLTSLAARLADAPLLEPAALGAREWSSHSTELVSLVESGQHLEATRRQLAPTFKPSAWNTDVSSVIDALEGLPADFSLEGFARIASLTNDLPALLEGSLELSEALGRPKAPINVREIDEMIRVAERVAAAPDADAEAFAAALWESGVERAAELAEAVEVLEQARGELGSELNEAAWEINLSDARRILASHGTSFFRVLSGEWRAAIRTVRSYLTNPRAPLEQQLALLDALGRGRRALETIRSESEFGQAVYASAWRGDRSKSAPLVALAEWMRSLRGLGAEPRLVASNGPNRERIGNLVSRLTARSGSVSSLISLIWDDLGSSKTSVFADAGKAVWADLEKVLEGASLLRSAHDVEVEISIAIDPNLTVRGDALRALAEGQRRSAQVGASDELGHSTFGSAWTGETSDWAALHAAAVWITANLDIHQLAARVADRTDLLARCRRTEQSRSGFVEQCEALLRDIKATAHSALSPGSIATEPLDSLDQ